MMNILDNLCATRGITSAGVCELRALVPFMSTSALEKAHALCPRASRVLVALFPYFAGETDGNLSLYARGMDYHAVIQRTLAPFAAQLGADSIALADDSPLPETQAARLSGVGKLGENGLIFDPVYGSFVFIGTILTAQELPLQDALHRDGSRTPPPPADARVQQCLHCGACRKTCPQCALAPDGSVDQCRCLSALTQQGGVLAPQAAQAVADHTLIWGCDRCQTICPLNRRVPLTDNPAFRDDRISNLSLADVDGLTRRQFAAKYPDRAFTWRGPKPLVRNLQLKEENHAHD